MLERGCIGVLRSVPAYLTARYVEALPPLNALSVVNRRFPPHCASIQLGNRPADTAWANKQAAGLVTSCLAAPPTKHHPGGRARASATSGEGEGPTRSPPPARLVYLLDSRRGSCGHLAQFEANGESPDADLEGRRIEFASEPENLEVRNIVNR